MKTRILTAIVLIVVMGTILVFGEGQLEFLFSGGVVLLSTMASYEFMIRCHRHNKPVYWYHYLAIAFTFAFVLLNVLLFNHTQYFEYIMLAIFAIIFINLVVYLFDQRLHRGELGLSLLSIFYTSLGFIALAYLRQIQLELILYLLIITILTDTFAYFVGIRFGKHKLMPKVSPKKSIEGAIGGLIFGSIFATIYAMAYDLIFDQIIWTFLISVSISMVSQAGDLIASKFKREVGLKDYSNIFPGHGGVLDRFDSTMFAAFFFMILLQVI
jgi:phosphatidate cytidylyltransferase